MGNRHMNVKQNDDVGKSKKNNEGRNPGSTDKGKKEDHNKDKTLSNHNYGQQEQNHKHETNTAQGTTHDAQRFQVQHYGRNRSNNDVAKRTMKRKRRTNRRNDDTQTGGKSRLPSHLLRDAEQVKEQQNAKCAERQVWSKKSKTH